MSRYRNIPTLRPAEAVAWLAGLLRASSDLAEGLRGGAIYEHSEPAETPEGEPLRRYGVVMQERPAGGTRAQLDGRRGVNVIVRFECPASLGSYVDWHEEMHAATDAAVLGKTPDVESAAATLPIRKIAEPDVPAIDADDRTYYSTAIYRATFNSAKTDPQPA